jgi:hypothetical protein
MHDKWWRVFLEPNLTPVWNCGMRTVPVGNEVAASCLTAAKFDACALLHSTLRTLVLLECACVKLFQSTSANSTHVSARFLSFFYLSFVINRWMKLGGYFKFSCYLAYAEPTRKIVKCALLPFLSFP